MKSALASLLLLSLGTLSLAQYTNFYPSIYARDALADADAEAQLDYDDLFDLLYARDAAAKGSSWTPKIEGVKPIKDTLKCNSKHVCSGEIVV